MPDSKSCAVAEIVPATGPTATGLLEIVQAADGNLAEAARRLGTKRSFVISRLKSHGLLPAVRQMRKAVQAAEIDALRATLDEIAPSDRVRVLLAQGPVREALVRELEARDDLDTDARTRLRRHRRAAQGGAAAEDGTP